MVGVVEVGIEMTKFLNDIDEVVPQLPLSLMTTARHYIAVALCWDAFDGPELILWINALTEMGSNLDQFKGSTASPSPALVQDHGWLSAMLKDFVPIPFAPTQVFSEALAEKLQSLAQLNSALKGRDPHSKTELGLVKPTHFKGWQTELDHLDPALIERLDKRADQVNETNYNSDNSTPDQLYAKSMARMNIQHNRDASKA